MTSANFSCRAVSRAEDAFEARAPVSVKISTKLFFSTFTWESGKRGALGGAGVEGDFFPFTPGFVWDFEVPGDLLYAPISENVFLVLSVSLPG